MRTRSLLAASFALLAALALVRAGQAGAPGTQWPGGARAPRVWTGAARPAQAWASDHGPCCPQRPVRATLVRAGEPAPRPACDACADWLTCENALHDAGASVQVVPIKNGVMQVFTADTPARVRLVQSLLARRGEYIRNLDQAGERAHLCASCRVMRGAAVSGKLVRQIINLEGGCITLTTSTDLDVVTRIYTLAGLPAPVRPRS